MIKKGVIIAGGDGTRLRPMTSVVNKQLLPIYNKPMILYPLKTLSDMGIKDILIISNGQSMGSFMQFLGDGSDYGVNLTYRIQKQPLGIAHAVSLAENFVGDERFAVILGDNIYETPVIPPDNGCGIVLKETDTPQRFGIYYNDKIEEKPLEPKSKMAVTGLYFYTPEVFNFIKTMKPSARGEMEITDVNNWCLKNLITWTITYKDYWADAGTPDSLLAISNFIYEKEKREKK